MPFGRFSAVRSVGAYYAIKATRFSFLLNDISQGQDATPLWIPQSAMAAGSVMFAIALLDNLVCLALSGRNAISTDIR